MIKSEVQELKANKRDLELQADILQKLNNNLKQQLNEKDAALATLQAELLLLKKGKHPAFKSSFPRLGGHSKPSQACEGVSPSSLFVSSMSSSSSSSFVSTSSSSLSSSSLSSSSLSISSSSFTSSGSTSVQGFPKCAKAVPVHVCFDEARMLEILAMIEGMFMNNNADPLFTCSVSLGPFEHPVLLENYPYSADAVLEMFKYRPKDPKEVGVDEVEDAEYMEALYRSGHVKKSVRLQGGYQVDAETAVPAYYIMENLTFFNKHVFPLVETLLGQVRKYAGAGGRSDLMKRVTDIEFVIEELKGAKEARDVHAKITKYRKKLLKFQQDSIGGQQKTLSEVRADKRAYDEREKKRKRQREREDERDDDWSVSKKATGGTGGKVDIDLTGDD